MLNYTNSKQVILLTIVFILLFGCAGKTPTPIMTTQYGDEFKSCDGLAFEINNMQQNMHTILPKTDKTGKNVALGIAGCFFLIPWFFMDFSHAEQVEYEAYRNRYNHLASIAISKKCGIKKENYPSVEDLKHIYDEYNEKKKSKKKKVEVTIYDE